MTPCLSSGACCLAVLTPPTARSVTGAINSGKNDDPEIHRHKPACVQRVALGVGSRATRIGAVPRAGGPLTNYSNQRLAGHSSRPRVDTPSSRRQRVLPTVLYAGPAVVAHPDAGYPGSARAVGRATQLARDHSGGGAGVLGLPPAFRFL